MSYVMALNQPISEESNYAQYGEVIVGSEGDTYGTPDIDTGDNFAESYGYLMFGGDTNQGGLDTGILPFGFDGNLATGVDTVQAEQTIVTSQGFPSSAFVGSADVIVGADVPANVSLENIAVNFFQGNTLEETDTFSGMSVDTTDPSSSGAAEDVLTVVPSAPNDNRVVVTGAFRMSSPDGTYPGPTNIFCQVFIHPAAR